MEELLNLENKIEEAISQNDISENELSLLHDEVVFSSLERNAYFYYLLGYVKFFYPNRSAKETDSAIEHFEHSHDLDATNQLTLYYLGFLYFEKQDYQKSASIFRKIDGVSLVRSDLKWRNYKVQEMILCCQLSLSNKETEFCHNLIQAINFVNNIIANESEEEYNYPIDIIRVTYLVLIRNRYKCDSLKILCEIMNELDIADTYNEEYSLFKLATR